MNKKRKTQADIDWKNRTLCSDGNCIGIIGPDGKCKECGNPYEGKLQWLNSSDSEDQEKQIEKEEDVQAGEEPSESTEGMAQDDLDWENRTLCSDGNCVGVIGTDGRCKECGKPLEDG